MYCLPKLIMTIHFWYKIRISEYFPTSDLDSFDLEVLDLPGYNVSIRWHCLNWIFRFFIGLYHCRVRNLSVFLFFSLFLASLENSCTIQIYVYRYFLGLFHCRVSDLFVFLYLSNSLVTTLKDSCKKFIHVPSWPKKHNFSSHNPILVFLF